MSPLTDLSGFPATTQSPILGVDLTPDSEMVVRILEAYRNNCDVLWEVHGLTESAHMVYATMNAHQQRRAELLDAAIVLLECDDAPSD